MTLTEFLLARIAEDEAVARAAAGESAYPHYGDTAAEEVVAMAEGEGCALEGTQHFARWLPARVLAECEAKRQIVEYAEYLAVDPDESGYSDGTSGRGAMERVLRFLALPYADHPDYPFTNA
jgi:hypothetical protein